MDFEKSDCFSTHTVTSSNVLCDKETGRVVATFYEESDLDHVIGNEERNSIIDECISKIKSCELVAQDVKRIRLHEALGALAELKNK
jgi:hypothetical protein